MHSANTPTSNCHPASLGRISTAAGAFYSQMECISVRIVAIRVSVIRVRFQDAIQYTIVRSIRHRSRLPFEANSDPGYSLGASIGMQRTSVLMCVSMSVNRHTPAVGSSAYRYACCTARYPILLLNSSLNGHVGILYSASLEANSHRCSPGGVPIEVQLVSNVAYVQQVVASLAPA